MPFVQRDLPSGTVTFLFTDVEGSTKLLHERGAEEYAKALAEHRRLLREVFDADGGVEVDTQGDAFFVAFPTASGALRAAEAGLKRLAAGPIRVRMGIHTGTPLLTDEGYVGVDVHRAARIAACGHGGQVLVSASTAALVNTDKLRDLGEHRLKDLSAPERIFQFGDEEFPPLTSLHQTNLPIASTPFLGRQSELREILDLMTHDGVRLVTLTGPGGTGKTRLAAQAAAELSPRYPQGIWWIPLASVREPNLVLEAAAGILGTKDSLAQRIADRSMLLIFDNFEQVVQAAGDVAGLLASCPNLDVLVTSREPLHIAGEQEYAVPPLVRQESIELFGARASAVKRDFESDDAVSEICRRLDDLPLALELAAARVKVLSPRRILERLEHRLPVFAEGARDLPDRQRTLNATIAWSYDLLSENERSLFARFGVFVGGCTLDAAEAICDAELTGLAALLDKSLLRREGDRYLMLETIREYASERLEATGQGNESRRRHAAYYTAFADKTMRDRTALQQRLAAEDGNFGSSLEWLVEHGDVAQAMTLVLGVWAFWLYGGRLREGQAWFERVIALPGASESADFGDLLVIAGEFPRYLGDFARARELMEAGLVRLRQSGRDRLTAAILRGDVMASEGDLERDRMTAAILRDLGDVVASEGDLERARTLHEEALAIRRKIGEPMGISHALNGLTILALHEGDFSRATALAEEEVELMRRPGAPPEHLSASLHPLAEALRKLGKLPRAAMIYQEALLASFGVGDLMGIAECLDGLADVAAANGSTASAAALWGAAQKIFDETGLRPWNAKEALEGIAAARSALGPQTFEEAWRAGKAMSRKQAVTKATAIAAAAQERASIAES
jgi:predicted ATPase/class 3 adenylate cyclase